MPRNFKSAPSNLSNCKQRYLLVANSNEKMKILKFGTAMPYLCIFGMDF